MCGVSTRRVDQLVESLGLRISKSEVSRSPRCSMSRSKRSVSVRWRPLPLSVRPREDREGPRRRPRAAQVRGDRPRRPRDRPARDHRPGRRRGGDRSVLRAFLRSLVARGLVGVQLAISDAHPGLRAALRRCSAHRGSAAPCTSCATCASRPQDQHYALGASSVGLHRRERRRSPLATGDAVAQLEPRLPKIAALLQQAEDDVLAFYAFPASTGPSCAARTRWSGSTARSAGAPTSWGSSPTTPR